MSTRSIIALADGDGFRDGVYVHSDGYPSGRGPILYRMFHDRDGDAERLWNDLNAGTKGGWSFLHAGETYTNWNGKQTIPDSLGERGEWVPGTGYKYLDSDDCRSDWHGEEWKEGPPFQIEWVYALHIPSATLSVYGCDYSARRPILRGSFCLNDPEPNWADLEDMEDA